MGSGAATYYQLNPQVGLEQDIEIDEEPASGNVYKAKSTFAEQGYVESSTKKNYDMEARVGSKIFEASVDLEALMTEDYITKRTPTASTVELMSLKCFGQEGGSSWALKFTQDYASCLMHFRDDDSGPYHPDTGAANYQLAYRCHRFISSLTSRVNLQHWACAPNVVCEIAKLTKIISPDFDCVAQARCWVYMKPSRFWREVILNFGKRFKSLLDTRSFGVQESLAFAKGVSESYTLQNTAQFKGSPAERYLKSIFSEEANAQTRQTQKPDGTIGKIVWWKYKCTFESDGECLLLLPKPTTMGDLVRKYKYCRDLSNSAESADSRTDQRFYIQYKFGVEFGTGNAEVDIVHCDEFSEVFEVLAEVEQCQYMISCLEMLSKFQNAFGLLLTCKDVQVCHPRGSFSTNIDFDDADNTLASYSRLLNNELKQELFKSADGFAGSSEGSRFASKTTVKRTFWRQISKQNNVKALKSINTCYSEIINMKRAAMRAKKSAKAHGASTCPFELFIRLVPGEMGIRPIGPIMIGENLFPSAVNWLDYVPGDNLVAGEDLVPSIFKNVQYAALNEEAFHFSDQADTANINTAFKLRMEKPILEEGDFAIPDTLAVFRKMCVMGVSSISNQIKFTKKSQIESRSNTGGDDPSMSRTTGAGRSEFQIFNPMKDQNLIFSASSLFAENHVFTRRITVQKTKETQYRDLTSQEVLAVNGVLDQCADMIMISGITSFVCPPECNNFFVGFKGCVALVVRKFQSVVSKRYHSFVGGQQDPETGTISGRILVVDGQTFESHVIQCASNVAVRQRDYFEEYNAAFEQFDTQLALLGLSVQTTIWNPQKSQYFVSPSAFGMRAMSMGALTPATSESYKNAVEQLMSSLLSAMMCKERASDISNVFPGCHREVNRQISSLIDQEGTSSTASGAAAVVKSSEGEIRMISYEQTQSIWVNAQFQGTSCIETRREFEDWQSSCELETGSDYWSLYFSYLMENGDDGFSSFLFGCAKDDGRCGNNGSPLTGFSEQLEGQTVRYNGMTIDASVIERALVECSDKAIGIVKQIEHVTFVHTSDASKSRAAAVKGSRRSKSTVDYNNVVRECAEARMSQYQKEVFGYDNSENFLYGSPSDGVDGNDFYQKWYDKVSRMFSEREDAASWFKASQDEFQRRKFMTRARINVIWVPDQEVMEILASLSTPVVDIMYDLNVEYTVRFDAHDIGSFIRLTDGIMPAPQGIPSFDPEQGEQRTRPQWVELYAFLLQKVAETQLYYVKCVETLTRLGDRAPATLHNSAERSKEMSEAYIIYMIQLEVFMHDSLGSYLSVEDVSIIVRYVAGKFDEDLSAALGPIVSKVDDRSMRFNTLMQFVWLTLKDLAKDLAAIHDGPEVQERVDQATLLGHFVYNKLPNRYNYAIRVDGAVEESFLRILQSTYQFFSPVENRYDADAIFAALAAQREQWGLKNPYSLSNAELHFFLYSDTGLPETPFFSMFNSYRFRDGFAETLENPDLVAQAIMDGFVMRIFESKMRDPHYDLKYYTALMTKQMILRDPNEFFQILTGLAASNKFQIELPQEADENQLNEAIEDSIYKLLLSTLFPAIIYVYGNAMVLPQASQALFNGMLMDVFDVHVYNAPNLMDLWMAATPDAYMQQFPEYMGILSEMQTLVQGPGRPMSSVLVNIKKICSYANVFATRLSQFELMKLIPTFIQLLLEAIRVLEHFTPAQPSTQGGHAPPQTGGLPYAYDEDERGPPAPPSSPVSPVEHAEV